MVFIVYVLESEKNGLWYVGFTQDLSRRINEHNLGRSQFTSGHLPWKVIYKETVSDRLEARAREKYFKTAAGKRYIHKQLLKG